MIKINLLPKEYQKKRFSVSLEKNALYLVGGGLAILILLAAYTLFFQVMPSKSLDSKIELARQEAANYDKEIALVNKLNAQKDLILTRMRTIERLDRDREVWIKFVSDLGSRITDYLWLTKFGAASAAQPAPGEAAAPSKTVIEGRSFSLNSLATFLVRLKRSPYLSNLDLVQVTLEEETAGEANQLYEAYYFVIHCDLVLAGMDAAQTEDKTSADKLAAGSEF
jgi:Tfp pilus assembly protein PilN